jgi:hypothetical protein
MKQIFVAITTIGLIISCGGDANKKSQPDGGSGSTAASVDEEFFINLINEMTNNGDLDEKTQKQILANLKEKKADLEKKEASSAAPLDTTGLVTVNSLDLFADIYKDRSLNLQKYIGKSLLVTDLVLCNVQTLDADKNDGKFIRVAEAFPYNPKMASFAYKVPTGEWGGGYDSLSFNGQYLMLCENGNEMVDNGYPVRIEFAAVDEMSKMQLLDWESNVGLSFSHKINVLCELKYENVNYTPGNKVENDIKANGIKLTLKKATISK